MFPGFFHFADKRLVNHSIRNVQVNDVDTCELLCYHEPNCVSINFKTIANDKGTYSCELSRATHRGYETDFMDTAGYSYRGTDVSCSSLFCFPFVYCCWFFFSSLFIVSLGPCLVSLAYFCSHFRPVARPHILP